MEQFKHLGTSPSASKSRKNTANACCYHLVHNLLSDRNTKIIIYRIINLTVVLYGCETWSITMREEHRLKVFKIRVLRKIFGPKWDKVTENWRRL